MPWDRNPPSTESPPRAALLWAGGAEVPKHGPWSEFHTAYSVLHPSEAPQESSLMENRETLEQKRGLHEVIVYKLCENKVRQPVLTETSLVGTPL